MRKVLSKKGKIIISIVACFLAVVIILSSVLANLQYAKENFALYSEARDILLKNFEKVAQSDNAELKRVIDNTHPMNLVNYYGGEDIVTFWNTLSKKQQECSILLLIPGQTLLAKNETNLHNLESWADTCEQKGIPYAIQSINGETHMEARMPVKYIEERFAVRHKWFYGINAAELYNGVTWRGKAESDNSLYIIDTIKLCAKYGAYFIWTDTNLNYKNGMILDWLENNESLYSTFKMYSQNICMLNKESIADPATYGLLQGLWLSGLIGNWGVSSDWWHWQIDGNKSLFGEHDDYIGNEWEQIFCYPENMYVQSMMLVISRGATCFSQEAPNFSISYKGEVTAGYEYSLSPFLDRIMDGRITIPTLSQVFDATSFAVIGKENYLLSNYNMKESNLYPAMGQSGIVPLLPKNLRNTERAIFTERGIVLVNYKVSRKEFMRVYGENDANTYLTNTGQNWYFINNLENKQGSKYAKFAPKYAGAESFYIESEEHCSAVISDTRYGFNVYLSNYRTDKTFMIQKDSANIFETGNWADYVAKFLTLDDRTGSPLGATDSELRKTVIEIVGTFDGGEPFVEFTNNSNGSGKNNRPYTIKKDWNSDNKVLRLEILHNGIVEFNVRLDDTEEEYSGVWRREIDDIYDRIDADTTKLQELVKEKIENSNIYTYFSYLEYDKQFEKAKVMISEKTYSQKQIDSQVKALKKATDNLINIEKEIEVLQKVNNGSYQAAAMVAYDSLLREMLSCLNYVNGRSNKLTYASIYKNKDINCTFSPKRRSITKAYNNLLLFV